MLTQSSTGLNRNIFKTLSGNSRNRSTTRVHEFYFVTVVHIPEIKKASCKQSTQQVSGTHSVTRIIDQSTPIRTPSNATSNDRSLNHKSFQSPLWLFLKILFEVIMVHQPLALCS